MQKNFTAQRVFWNASVLGIALLSYHSHIVVADIDVASKLFALLFSFFALFFGLGFSFRYLPSTMQPFLQNLQDQILIVCTIAAIMLLVCSIYLAFLGLSYDPDAFGASGAPVGTFGLSRAFKGFVFTVLPVVVCGGAMRLGASIRLQVN